MNLVEMSRDEADALLRADHAGDQEAKRFWTSLFDDGAECFLCGKASADRKVSLIADPAAAARVIVVPYCVACFTLPAMYRYGREMKLLKKIWPDGGWTFNRPPTRKKRERIHKR
jgi:hypothetical protein